MTTGAHGIVAVGTACLVVQIVSATVNDRSLETPNTATWIARSLVEQGEFSAGGRRAYHLPAEPVYLAAGFRALPPSLWRYLHVPVVGLLVVGVAVVAASLGGPRLAMTAGTIALVDPFVLVHGPVWDDAVLAASLEWTVFAVLVSMAVSPPRLGRQWIGQGLALFFAAGIAAVTRTHSQVALVAVAATVLAIPGLKQRRDLRMGAVMIIAGMALALMAWGARNAHTLGTFVIGSTRDGKALVDANCPYTRQGIREFGGVGQFTLDCAPQPIAQAFALNELESDRALRQYAIDYMITNPIDVTITAAFKLLVSLSGYDFTSFAFSVRNLVAVGSSVTMLGLGLPGLWRLSRAMPPSPARQLFVTVAWVTVVTTVLMLAIGPTGLRYRVSLAALLSLGAGATLVSRVDRRIAPSSTGWHGW